MKNWFLFVMLSLVVAFASHAQPRYFADEIISLWATNAPGGGGPRGEIQVSRKGAFTHIAKPMMYLYRPLKPNGKSVLIAAGGGYKRINMKKEAVPAALWLKSLGYTAYILVYRLPLEHWRDGNLVALQDAQRAIRLIRAKHQPLSLLGFSAGAHLLALAGLKIQSPNYPPQDSIDQIPIKLSGIAMIYPIVTLMPPYSHTSTHKVLVGKGASLEQDAMWSVENYVTKASPAIFAVQADDDAISSVENTHILEKVCQENGVPIDVHLFKTGGHGFAMGRAGTPTIAWPNMYLKWLNKL